LQKLIPHVEITHLNGRSTFSYLYSPFLADLEILEECFKILYTKIGKNNSSIKI